MVKVEFLGGPMDGQSQFMEGGINMWQVTGPGDTIHLYRLHLAAVGRNEIRIAVPNEWNSERAHAELLARYGRKPGQKGKMSA